MFISSYHFVMNLYYDYFIRAFLLESNYSNGFCPESLTKNLLDHFDSNIQNICLQISRKLKFRTINSPWIDKDLIECISKKHELFKRVLSNEIPYEHFKIYRNLLTKTIKLAKKIYLAKQFRDIGGNQKETWKLINKCSNNKKEHIKFEVKTNDGSITCDQNTFVKQFSNFFDISIKGITNDLPNTVCDVSDCKMELQYHVFCHNQ